MTDLKALKKLAETCRKAGIKHYKDSTMEFTLTDDAPVIETKGKKAEFQGFTPNTDVSTDDVLTEDQILFYSVSDITQGNS